ncbi:MAG TPA: DAK2 domain-containing protein, partial [Miltoncostaeaceae bacterium]|nr:DAK2 domain-containing protein [Miltoncostaeaceae bacterium]
DEVEAIREMDPLRGVSRGSMKRVTLFPASHYVTPANKLRAAIEGIKQRGQADVGDKTLLDALVPATDTLEERVAAGDPMPSALARAAETARASAEATTSMLAKRGRASYTGERSIGSPDAGAMGVAVMFERLAAEWPEA